MCPELFPTDTCALCGSARATMQHMLWGCHQSPLADEDDPLPPRVKRVATSRAYEHQKMAAELALAAIERHARGQRGIARMLESADERTELDGRALVCAAGRACSRSAPRVAQASEQGPAAVAYPAVQTRRSAAVPVGGGLLGAEDGGLRQICLLPAFRSLPVRPPTILLLTVALLPPPLFAVRPPTALIHWLPLSRVVQPCSRASSALP
ncbi:hypothetical protein HPB48_004387 [Haemaphysalis longicornis]|uniref:Uncharacterized protein n=1 Tax=Haemaphysalis longicornis TaxID=44386 RepID=A0A9J6G311_HAELO|nr:hypothetical protein HPB48_004387 [Haemaphysalis longicornis]